MVAHYARKRPCVKDISLERPIQTNVNERDEELLGENSQNVPVSPLEPTTSPASVTTIPKPPLKWVGGKTQILQHIIPLFPKSINNQQEPFLGGGSVLIGVLTKLRDKQITIQGTIYCSDLNPNIIALYQNIQNSPEELITQCQTLVQTYRNITGSVVNRKPNNIDDALSSKESFYFWIRQQFNQLPCEEKLSPRASAMLIFLNKTCFRGLYREGPRGFNVPFGNYKNPQIIDESHIIEISRLIQGVVFSVAPFTEALRAVEIGDFVYMDPPQAPEQATSFVSYTKNGFSGEDHKTLFEKCADLNRKGARFLLSNADVPIVRETFPNTQQSIQIISCRRAINSKNPEARTNEVLISNPPSNQSQ